MKIELGTEKLKSAVSKVSKGVGATNLFVTTQIIGIEGKDGNVTLSATDKVANIKVTMKDVISKDIVFYTNTKADLFKKLLDRTQSANLEIVYNDEDGAGTLARIQEIKVEGEPKDVKVSDLKKFGIYLKGTFPDSITNPVYMGYRVFNNKAMTYNNYGANLVELNWDEDILIPKSIVSLFDTLEGDIAKVTVEGTKIKLVAGDVELTGTLKSDVQDYSTDRFTKLIYSTDIFVKETTIDRVRLINALDRIKLFIDKGDDGVFSLDIGDKSVVLLTLSNNCVEQVDFESCNNPEVIERNIGMAVLETALSAVRGDKITIAFGNKVGLRIYDEVDKAYLLVPYARAKN